VTVEAIVAPFGGSSARTSAPATPAPNGSVIRPDTAAVPAAITCAGTVATTVDIGTIASAITMNLPRNDMPPSPRDRVP